MNPAYPQYPQQYPQQYIPHPSQLPPQSNMPMTNPPDLAMLAHQGYVQQQQQLAAMAAASGSQMRPPGMPMNMGVNMNMANMGMMRPGHPGQNAQMMMQQQQQRKKKPRPTPSSQLISRHSSSLQPPHHTDYYIKNALAHPQSQVPGQNPQIVPEGIEPWADALDEIDARELAMGRYRLRHEVMSEIFSGEMTKDILDVKYDPWSAIGVDHDTLAEQVATLEKEVQDMQDSMDNRLASFKGEKIDMD